MGSIIDFHVHVFPDLIERYGQGGALVPLLQSTKRRAKKWLRPVSASLHRAQTFLRHVPEEARWGLDQIGGLFPIPGLLVESTPSDLFEAMEENGVSKAVAIAAPPFSSNEFILELSRQYPELIPAVNIPASIAKPAQQLKQYVKQGAKLLKIHAAIDGESPDSPRYRALLKTAAESDLPVILHTGCIHSHLIYKQPKYGSAELFEKWFGNFPQVRFILAHMNFHEPEIALDLASEHENLYVDTSWQPIESIAEAVRRLGSERVLFGTDWPLVGHNLQIGIERIQKCVESGLITEKDRDRILGENALALLGGENGSSD